MEPHMTSRLFLSLAAMTIATGCITEPDTDTPHTQDTARTLDTTPSSRAANAPAHEHDAPVTEHSTHQRAPSLMEQPQHIIERERAPTSVPAEVIDAPDFASRSWSSVHVDREYTCALDIEGRAVCWGVNRFGRANAPQDVSFSTLATSEKFACGISDGQILCWGDFELSIDSLQLYGEITDKSSLSIGRDDLLCVTQSDEWGGSHYSCVNSAGRIDVGGGRVPLGIDARYARHDSDGAATMCEIRGCGTNVVCGSYGGDDYFQHTSPYDKTSGYPQQVMVDADGNGCVLNTNNSIDCFELATSRDPASELSWSEMPVYTQPARHNDMPAYELLSPSCANISDDLYCRDHITRDYTVFVTRLRGRCSGYVDADVFEVEPGHYRFCGVDTGARIVCEDFRDARHAEN